MILFISTQAGDPWGGSEELWTRAATLLAKQGVPVAASVQGWPQLDRRIIELLRAGVDLQPRPFKSSLFTRARRLMSGKIKLAFDINRSFGNASPRLVVISDGAALPPIELLEMCAAKGWPFATLANSFHWGMCSDELASRFRGALTLAQRCYFVSQANRVLLEKQLGHDFYNAEVIHNPVIVKMNSPIPWPPNSVNQELRIACVARLFPAQKGQDILIDILATQSWKERNWRLTFYGDGPNRDVLERLVERHKLKDRITFAGHVAVEKIWHENHILVAPSRYEGGPMTTVEAMWCGRPVVATNVGINPEVVKEGVTGFLAEAAVAECFGSALERMWAQRERLQEIGKFGASFVREFIPDDPVGIFAEKLKALANLPAGFNPSGKTKKFRA
jgi:glycosyltransferase involved in cell wall biosynthesis